MNKTNVEALRTFTTKKRSAPQNTQKFTMPIIAQTHGTHERWQAEIERLEPLWKHGRRQHLAMALAGYGLAGLAIDPETIKAAVTTLCERTQDREVKRRLQAVTITAKKFARGERIAWRPFYDDAGVDPPTRSVVSAEVHRRLEQGIFTLFHGVWKGKEGNSAHLVYGTLLWFASRFGREHERGVEVAVSLRHLTLEANLGSKNTTRRALQYLERCGLVGEGTASKRLEAGQFVLFFENEMTDLVYSSHIGYKQSILYKSRRTPLGGLYEWVNSTKHVAMRQGALGHLAARLTGILAILDEPISTTDLAQFASCHLRSAYKPLNKLATHGIVTVTRKRYSLAADWQAALDHVATELGAYEARARQAATYDRERDTLRMRYLQQQHDTPFTEQDTDTLELVPRTKNVDLWYY